MPKKINERFFCGARCRTKNGAGCTQRKMQNGRCKMHGGKSTGSVTQAGKMRSAMANFKHGFYTNTAISERRALRESVRQWRDGDDNLLNASI